MLLKNTMLKCAIVFSLMFAASACAPRPTRPPETVATFTRDPHPKSPTPAPSPTPGPPQTVGVFIFPTLEQPLVNERLALQKIYELELRIGTRWQDPWCIETLDWDPGRILMKRYNSENEYLALFGGGGRFGNDEPVWVITILGPVVPPPMPGGWGSRGIQYFTYIIGERTGAVRGMSGGASTQSLTVTPVPTQPPRTRKPRTPKARTPNTTATPTLQVGTPTLVLTKTP